MGTGQFVGINLGFGAVDATCGFEARHCSAELWVNQPVASGHGTSVSKVRSVLHDHRITIRSAHDDGEVTFWSAAEELGDLRDLLWGWRVHFQN